MRALGAVSKWDGVQTRPPSHPADLSPVCASLATAHHRPVVIGASIAFLAPSSLRLADCASGSRSAWCAPTVAVKCVPLDVQLGRLLEPTISGCHFPERVACWWSGLYPGGGCVTDNEKYVEMCISSWVWAGFYAPEEIREMMNDVLEPDCNLGSLEALLVAQLELKTAAEISWPKQTDCDRLDGVFHHLCDTGICALSNAGYTMSDGYTDVAEVVAQAPKGHYYGYCFYHGQDVERAVEGQGMMVAFGDLSNDPARDCVVGCAVAKALSDAGFVVVWDGTDNTRINIPSLDWKRRCV